MVNLERRPSIPNRLPEILARMAEALPFFKGGASAEVLRVGLSNTAVKVRAENKNFLVKFAIAPASKPSVFIQANYEKKIAGRLNNFGITPQFHSSGKIAVSGRVFPYTIQEYLEGRQLAYSPSELQAAGRTLHLLHARTEGKKGICDYRVLDPSSYLSKQSLKYNSLYPRFPGPKTSLLGKLNESGEQALSGKLGGDRILSLIHNDLTPENVLISGSRAYLIDWGWAMYSSPALDVCNFLSPFTTSWSRPNFLTEKAAPFFLRSYFLGIPGSKKNLLLESARKYWLAYNSLLANWIYFEFLPQHPLRERSHFQDGKFLGAAIKAVGRLGAFLEKWA